MKTTPFLEYIVYDVLGDQPVTFRPMMGAHILYHEGKVFAIVEGDELYFKSSKDTEIWYQEHGGEKFTYKKEGKDTHLNYYSVPPSVYEDKAALGEWFDTALSVAMLPKKNK